MIEIYTDGGCIENPGGIGAWAFAVVKDRVLIHSAAGGEMVSTNNRTELLAVISGMQWAMDNNIGPATVKTDSDLTVKCGNRQWKRRKNLDLWARFDKVNNFLFELKWIRGHNGSKWNEFVDQMCTQEMEKMLVNRKNAEFLALFDYEAV